MRIDDAGKTANERTDLAETNFFSCFKAETGRQTDRRTQSVRSNLLLHEIISASDTAVALSGLAVLRHRPVFRKWPVRIQAATPTSYDV